MTTLTIPRQLAQQGDLVLIPRSEYKELLSLKKAFRIVKPTKSDIRQLARADREIKAEKFKPWSQVKRELANLHQ